MILNCPLPAALPAVPMPTCPFKLDQIVRLGFQLRQPVLSPAFTTLVLAQTLSNWQTYLNASDATKIVVTPLFAGMVIPASEGQLTGGNDNSTINGIPEYNGEGSVTVTGVLKNIPPATKRALDQYSQFSLASSVGATNLQVYFFNREGYTFAKNPSGTIYTAVDIFNFRISSLGSEGFNAPNVHNFSFSMNSTWADYLASFKPTFDPLTELIAA